MNKSSFRRQAISMFFLCLVFAGSWSAALEHAPDWTNSTTCRYGLPGEGSDTVYVDEMDPGGYALCRFGNWLASDDETDDRVTLEFNHLTTGPFTTVGMNNEHGGGLFLWNTGMNPNQRVTFSSVMALDSWGEPPEEPDIGLGSVEIEGNSTQNRDLYRHFTMTDYQLPRINSSTKKYVILIHGWNPNSRYNAYDDGEFAHLYSSLFSWLFHNAPDWDVLKYHMESDTDTGPNGWQQLADNAVNGTEAAEIARLHGYHMAKLIKEKCPNIESVHLIAHSAGSWAARSCFQYLLANHSEVVCQMTLLDAYVPEENNSVQPASQLGVTEMENIPFPNTSVNRARLDNYYSSDVSDWSFGTQEDFNWGAFEHGLDDVDVDDYGIPEWQKHFGPIEYYADSVDTDADVWISEDYEGGWVNSLCMNEPVFVEPPLEFQSDTLNPGDLLYLAVSAETRVGSFSGSEIWQWYKDGVPQDGQTSNTLSIPSATAANAGNYYVEVTYDGLTARSGIAVISVGGGSGSSPTINSVEPGALPPSDVRQLITIAGSGFSPATTLRFTWNGNAYDSLSQYLMYVDEGELQYNIMVEEDGVGTWTVAAIEGGLESVPYAFTVIDPQVTPLSFVIAGATSMAENTSENYTARVYYSDGTSALIPPVWSEYSSATSISSNGELTAGDVSSDTMVTIWASFTANGEDFIDAHHVTVVDEDAVELIQNGDFADDDDHWTLAGDFYADDRFSNHRSDPGYAYLSLSDGTPGNSISGDLIQYVNVPSGATDVELKYWYSVTTDETTTTGIYDTLEVQIISTDGSFLRSAGNINNLHVTYTGDSGVYDDVTIDLSEYAGETIGIRFRAQNDSSNPTVFRIDDVSIKAVVPATLVDLTIEGAAFVDELSSAQYQTLATYSDGSSAYVNANWSESSSDADISNDGELYTFSVTRDRNVRIEATYREDGVTRRESKNINVINIYGSATLRVSPDGSHTHPYTTWSRAAADIQTAVDIAAEGDTVLVANGTYRLSSPILVGLDSVKIQSVNGPDVTVIDGQGASQCLHIYGENTVISGFNITNGYTDPWSAGGGILCHADSIRVSDCVISGHEGTGMYGGTAYNCIFEGNSRGGMNNGTAYNCVFRKNISDFGAGMEFGTAYNCIFTANQASYSGGGIYDSTAYNCILWDNVASYAGEGDLDPNSEAYFSCSADLSPGVNGNITDDPLLLSSSRVAPESPCRGAGSAAYAFGADIDGESWLSPPSMGCDEWHGPGTVTGSLSLDFIGPTNLAVSFPGRYILSVEGSPTQVTVGFGDSTVITNRISFAHHWSIPGDYNVVLTAFNDEFPLGVSATQAVHVLSKEEATVYVSAESGSDTNDGRSWLSAKKTIQAAVNIADVSYTVLVSNGTYHISSEITVSNPMVIDSVNGSPVTIIDGGGSNRCFYVSAPDVWISGFTITNGVADAGGGVSCADKTVVVSNCVIVGNTASWEDGGGMKNGLACNCVFSGNHAGYYGGGKSYGAAYNCTFSGNSSFDGGGMSDGDAYNCTFSGNSADNGGGMFSGTAYNSVLWDNLASDEGDNLVYADAFHSCSPDLTCGVDGNITNAPLFIDALADNFRLQSNSPCINWGDNSRISTPTDLNDNPRVIETYVDMGAYEYQGIIGLSDSDADGMDDDWERLQGGNQSPFRICANGVNTVLEAYIAGLDPNDPNAAFLTSIQWNSPQAILGWNTASDRVYSVWWTTNLLDGFQPLETNILWTQGSYTNTEAPLCSFYKIKVELVE